MSIGIDHDLNEIVLKIWSAIGFIGSKIMFGTLRRHHGLVWRLFSSTLDIV